MEKEHRGELNNQGEQNARGTRNRPEKREGLAKNNRSRGSREEAASWQSA